MRLHQVLRTPAAGLGGTVAASGGVLVAKGAAAALGLFMGILATWVAVAGIWGLVQVILPNPGSGHGRNRGAFALIVFFLLSIPVYAYMAAMTYRLGEESESWFSLGILLVYCVLVWWALTAPKSRKS
jgi:hypothetical protein